ncbi:MAG: hypothetical protein ACUVVU_04460, partial [Tepidimonas sp.]|uniref:hypothetical protein n=1 Tax=Tepidimonas sp. TaxID=2002775 RepID=UPI004054B2C8
MKAESATHAAHGHAAHRPQGNRDPATDPRGGDPFALLLADLRAADDPMMESDAARPPQEPEDETTSRIPDPGAGILALLGHPPAQPSLPSQAEGGLPGAMTPADGDVSGTRSAISLAEQAFSSSADGAAIGSARADHPLAGSAADRAVDDVGDAAKFPVGAWVSTLARSKQRASTAAYPSAADGARDVRPDGTAAHLPAAMRADRLAATNDAALAPIAATVGAAAGLLDAGAPGERRDATRGTEAPGHGGHAAADAGGYTPGEPMLDPTEFGLQLGQALGDAFETIGAQLSLWAAGKTQRASFSVEDGLDDPLAVDVTVTDGVAQLSFRTDDGAMRQLIQAQAPAALADALARSGLTLGGLDVGGQSGRGQQDAPDGLRPRTTRVGLTEIAPASGVGPGART